MEEDLQGAFGSMVPEYLDVPIFPLPNVTFFPKTILPLHVFEPRYREMVANSLRGDRLIGVALLKEGWQKNYFGSPPTFKTFGVGKIIDFQQYDNDCYDIAIEGLYRVRLIAEHQTRPFRVGRVSVLQDGPIDHIRDEVVEVHNEIVATCCRIAQLAPEYQETFQNVWSSHPHPCVTAEILASNMVVDAYDRQSILEELDPLRRLRLVLIQSRQILYQLSQGRVEK
jgi:Lon protease-like protein